jgi:hypothetical protein
MSDKIITQTQLNALERAVDKVFANLGIDIEFTRHFLDRVNDERNRKQITMQELALLLGKEYKKWGRTIAGMPANTEAVMKDLSSELNVPFVLKKDGQGVDLIAKTIMRKKDFKTPDRELPVESVNRSAYTESAHSKYLYYLQPGGEWKKGADGRSPGRKREDLPKGAKICESNHQPVSINQVREAWQQYQVNERIMDPREAQLRAALRYLEKKIASDTKDKMDASGHAFDIARSFNIGLGGRELFQLYQTWTKSDQAMESWIDDNQALIGKACKA